MSKITLLTDTHFIKNDSNLYYNYYDNFYISFFDKLVNENIDTIVMLGDTFDKRKSTNHISLWYSKKIFFNRAEELNIKIIMIIGNHDTPYKNNLEANTPSLVLTEYKNIKIIDKPTDINVKGLDITMLPWICDDNYNDSMELIKNTKSKVCMGHLEISGYSMYLGVPAREGLDRNIFSKFDKLYSGHYHHKNLPYLGTPYELTWNDYGDPKGFHIFDTKTLDLEFIENKNKLFYKIVYGEHQDLDLSVYKDKIIKVIVTDKGEVSEFNNFMDKLYNIGAYEIKIIEDFRKYHITENSEQLDIDDTMNIVNNYIDKMELGDISIKVKEYINNLQVQAINQDKL